MPDCNTPAKRKFRSRAAAVRWHRRAQIDGKAKGIKPYLCRGGDHWHLTHDQRGWNDIPVGVDAQLGEIATRACARYTDTLLTSQGWTREEIVDAVWARLRNKYRQLRDLGQLERDANGQIRITT